MEWQCCPKCNGQGIVSKPPYVAGDVDQWSSTSTSFTCDVCHGAKIIPSPSPSTRDQELIEFVEWLTCESSPYAVMYGDQSDRFADDEREYTILQLLEQFRKHKADKSLNKQV